MVQDSRSQTKTKSQKLSNNQFSELLNKWKYIHETEVRKKKRARKKTQTERLELKNTIIKMSQLIKIYKQQI